MTATTTRIDPEHRSLATRWLPRARAALHHHDEDLAGVDRHARTTTALARVSRTDERSSTR